MTAVVSTFWGGSFALRHCTLKYNIADFDGDGGRGGGVAAAAGSVNLDHTIIAGNSRNFSTPVTDDVLGAVDARFSLVGDGTGATINDNGGNQIGTSVSPIDPLLRYSLENGGSTVTFVLLPGSPAIDAGDPAAVVGVDGVPLFDQRGAPFWRVTDGDDTGGARIDIGAYEAEVALVVDTLNDDKDENLSAGDLSLREAITQANSAPRPIRIEFHPSLHFGTINLTLGPLPTITKSMDIVGPGAKLLTIDASGNDTAPAVNDGGGTRIFRFNDDVFSNMLEVSLRGLTLTGGDESNQGGAIYNSENLTIEQSIITGNYSHLTGLGGAIFTNGALTLLESTVSDNDSGFDGGAIAVVGDLTGARTTTIIGTTISLNTTGARGGGLVVHGGLVQIRHSTIVDNVAGGSGTGIYLASPSPSQVEVYSSIIAGNVSGTGFGNTDVYDGAGAAGNFVSQGYNLIGLGNATGAFNMPGDQTGSTISTLDSLKDNGGPTPTHAPTALSPAINAGNPADVAGAGGVPLFDQRGNPFTRVNEGRIDKGAVEVGANSFVVDTLVDEYNGAGLGAGTSLREAVTDIQPGGTITFSVTGTISLALGELQVKKNLSISGPGANLLTIDASASDLTPNTNDGLGVRVFNVNDGSNTTLANVALSGLILTGGDAKYDGGAIYSCENLAISRTTITGNRASGFGGGIATRDANLTLTDSLISSNSAFNGGGIWSNTNLTGTQTTRILNSTISGNSGGNGSGVFNSDGLTTIRHSTITNHNAPFTSTVAATGNSQTRMEIYSSIIAGNDNFDLSYFGSVNPFVSGGYNLIGESNADAAFNMPGDQTAVANPLLAPLADNGGPTGTHALLAGSPAFNSGNPVDVAGAGSVPQYDQRGTPFSRVRNSRIDMGAFESDPILMVDTLVDENDGNLGVGDLSLREALALSDTFSTISFSVTGTILLTLGQLTIDRSVIIDGPGADLLTIDASGSDPTPTTNNGDGSRVFMVSDGNAASLKNVEIRGLNLTGGDPGVPVGTLSGGAIFTRENLIVKDCVITGNHTTATPFATGGGAIYSANTLSVPNSLNIFNCTITNNTSANEGGGIRQRFGNLVVERSTFEGNGAATIGGGISAADGGVSVTVRDSLFANNSSGNANGGGGGIFVYGASATITNCTITGNNATNSTNGGGGGIYTWNSNLVLRHCTVFGNTAAASGGGIRVIGAAVTLDHSILAGNFLNTASTRDEISGSVASSYSLIGIAGNAVINNLVGNQIGVGAFLDPQIAPLANNGGPIMTHALLAGSPAMDAGDPAAMAGVGSVPQFDQRGAPFTRVASGRIDIGAFESQPAGPALPGDYNRNNVVDAADYALWRNTLTQTVPTFSGADGDGDGTIGQGDLNVWRAHFGQTIGAGSGNERGASGSSLQAVVACASQPSVEMSPRHSLSSVSAAASFPIDRVQTNPTANSTSANLQPVVAAPQDDALLAWLASRYVDQEKTKEESSNRPEVAAANHADQDASIESLDAAFASLALRW